MPLSYSTQMNGLTPHAAVAGHCPYKYANVKRFLLAVQSVGVIAAYLLGFIYNYEQLAITGCPVRSIHCTHT